MNWITEKLDKLLALVGEVVKILGNIYELLSLIALAGEEDDTVSDEVVTPYPVVSPEEAEASMDIPLVTPEVQTALGNPKDCWPNGRTKDHTEMSREELLIGCKSYGIEVPPRTRNSTLIKWLKGAEAQEPVLPVTTEALDSNIGVNETKESDSFINETKEYTEEEVREILMSCFRAQSAKLGDQGKAFAVCRGILVEKGNGIEEVGKLEPEYYNAVVDECKKVGVE